MFARASGFRNGPARSASVGRWACVSTALLLVATPAVFALDASEVRGRQIYFEGTSASGNEINAVVGEEATILPASALPCVNCHGYDGLGRPEGGVEPTDIRWSQLIKSYGHVHEYGRRHGAFDEQSLGRSVISGVDPAGNRLDRAMPTYLMSQDDLNDLVAFMKVLEDQLDPGVEKDRVRIATLLPLEGPQAGLGRAMEAALKAALEDVNARGGVFGRRIELVTVALGPTPDATLERLQKTLADQRTFALVSGYTVGLDAELLDLLRHDSVPLVGPFTLEPGDAYLDGTAFYLYSGFADQVRTLADEALNQAGDVQRVIVASPSNGTQKALADAAAKQLLAVGRNAPVTANYVPGDVATLVESIRSHDAGAVLFLGAQEDLDAVLHELDVTGLTPSVLALSSQLSRPLYGAPRRFDRRIFVAYPTTSADISPRGRADYLDLAERYELPEIHLQAQTSALAAARLFVEGLQRAGRDLTRSRLVDSIEALYNFETGFTPPLIYGPNQRVGALGAHILVVDLENRQYVPPSGGSWRQVL